MPDGNAHFAANVACGLAMTGAAAWYAPALVAPVAAGALIGAFITPDLDLESTTHSEALLRRIPVIGLLFQMLWYPYALMCRHRGVSHWPVVGTLGRLAYIAIMAALIGGFALGWAALLDEQLPAVTWPAVPWLSAAALLAAWTVQDLTHWALDRTVRG